jgi:hypothetical protein
VYEKGEAMFLLAKDFDWKYIIAETAIIAVGVAMALAADTWWQDRSNQATEMVYLQGLQSEFSSTSEELSEEIAWAKSTIGEIDSLMNLMTSSQPAPPPKKVFPKLSAAFSTGVLRAVTATYDDLMTSGKAGILRSKPLRISLVEWNAQLTIHRRLEDNILAPLYIETDSFMIRKLNVPEAMGADRKWPVPFHTDISALLADRELWNTLAVRRKWTEARLASLEALQQRLDRIMALLGPSP